MTLQTKSPVPKKQAGDLSPACHPHKSINKWALLRPKAPSLKKQAGDLSPACHPHKFIAQWALLRPNNVIKITCP